MIVVDSVKQTCRVCPSQWSGTTRDGREIYVRYRWGYLSVRIPGVEGEEIFGQQVGDDLDGHLTYAALRWLTAREITWPGQCQ